MDCLFCKIRDKIVPSIFIFEDKKVFAINDINPQAPIHILIIPKHHIATINHITFANNDIISHSVSVAAQIAKDVGISESGYRLLYNINSDGGQEVYHIHLHLLGGRSLGWPPG